MGTIECNDEANNFKYKLVLETTVESLRLAIESKTGTSVAENCYAFIEAVEGISTGGDCTDCENNLQSCMDAKALLETEVNDLNTQITTLTSDLNTCTTDKTEIQSNLDDCIAEKVVIQDALDTANDSIAVLQYRLDTVNTQLNNVLGRVVVGTEVEKMTALAIDKNDIKDAIGNKTGSTLTEDLSTYSTSIDAIPMDSYVVESWEEQAGRDKLVGIINLYPETHNLIRIKVATKDGNDIFVDWGDGTVESVTNGFFEHTYNYKTLDSKLFSNDKKQAIATITTDVESDKFNDIETPLQLVDGRLNSSWNKIKLETNNDTLELNYGFAYGDLEEFEFIGDCNATTLYRCFYDLKSLRLVKFKNIKSGVSMSRMFDASSLENLTISESILFPSSTESMFTYGGYKRCRTNVTFDMSNATHCYYMFGTRKGITEVNLINTSHLTNWSYFTIGCHSLDSLDIDMSSATSATRAFEDLFNLKTINLTLLPVSTDITNCKILPASEIENLILNQLKDVSENDANEVLKLTGTVTEDELSQEALDHTTAYGWDLVF